MISIRLSREVISQPNQQDAFYKDCPDNREREQNVAPDCKAVLPSIFDAWSARRFIMAERAIAGPDTPLGHRCSNMVELIENYGHADSPWQVSNIKTLLVRTVQEIAEIKGRKMLAPPLKMLEEA